MAVFITGDIHSDVRRFTTMAFPEQKELTKDDIVIICGDFGLVWDYAGESESEKYWLNWLEDRPFTTVFVDGNHECFPRLYDYPVKEWNGGKVHEIRPSVLHLMRGEVFTIEGKKFFTFGGARSHDIYDGILDPETDPDWNDTAKQMYSEGKWAYRVKGRSWWAEEMPSGKEMENGINNLKKHNFKVDYVISHCCPTFAQSVLGNGTYDTDYLTDYFQSLVYDYGLDFSKWIFGHYHDNKYVLDRFVLLYEQITRLL